MSEAFKKVLFGVKKDNRRIKIKEGKIVLNKTAFDRVKDYLITIENIRGQDYCSNCQEKFEEFIKKCYEDPRRARLLADKLATECDCDAFDKAVSLLKTADLKSDRLEEIGAKIIPSFCSFDIRNLEGEEIDSYDVRGHEVKILDTDEFPGYIYSLNLKEIELDLSRIRAIKKNIKNLGNYEINDFSQVEDSIKKKVSKNLPKELLDILIRYTTGLEVLDILFEDPYIEDVYIDSPGDKSIHIYHSKYEECRTNIVSTKRLTEKISMRFRAKSGRAFGASSPFLHTSLEKGIRVAGITEPLTKEGTGFAFRKHKNKPWTLPQFVANDTMDAETAGLLSLLMSGQTSLLITGPRGSGKTSLLSALIAEIPQHYRFIVIEDTPEIPASDLTKKGYKIEHLITESSLGQTKTEELTADEALRHSLRLGESVLVIGEVRGPEAQSLFEAMRIGATGNIVMGTIHGSSPFDTYDRIVNDLGVPKTSFKACDAVVSLAFVREKGETRKRRKVTQVTEVGKKWEENPLGEGGFKDLIKLNYSNKELKQVKTKESKILEKLAHYKGYEIEEIRKEWEFRSFVQEKLVELSDNNPEVLELPFIIKNNNKMFSLMGEEESFSEIKKRWLNWLESRV